MASQNTIKLSPEESSQSALLTTPRDSKGNQALRLDPTLINAGAGGLHTNTPNATSSGYTSNILAGTGKSG
jgi:hypothetical protein